MIKKAWRLDPSTALGAWLGALSLGLFFLFAPTAFAAETIRAFDVQASLRADRQLTVTETIRYDFGDAWRHGIYRTIPERYDRNGAKYDLHLEVQDVRMDEGTVPWSVSRANGELTLKIGDADKTVTDAHDYRITYATHRAVNDFPDDSHEWYWNVTGNAWEVPIGSATLSFDGPATPTATVCYTGTYGSTVHDCTITSDGGHVVVSANQALGPNEGLTVALKFSPDSIQHPNLLQEMSDVARDNLPLLTPIWVFLFMLLVWFRYGRDPKGRGTVIAQYEEPRGLPPALQVALQDQKVPLRAITATILDLGRRGYLEIEFEPEEQGHLWKSKHQKFTLIKTKEPDEKLLPYEQTVLDGLFTSSVGERTTLDALKGKFWKSIQKVNTQIFDELRSRKLFDKNPMVVRGVWIAVGLFTGFVHVWLVDAVGELMFVAGIVSGLIIIAFGWFMPRKTKEGAIVLEEVEGFKLFLSVTEKDRLAFTDAPERRPEQFARFLPAAVAFGVEREWAKHFEGIQVQPPSYVHGAVNGWTAFQFATLSDTLHQASASSAFVAPSSAGRGGSGFSGGGSGGGFGGGGGGSW